MIGKGIYRFDNAPHKKWKQIKTFPHHFHSGEDMIVKESHLPEKPQSAIEEVLNFIVTVLKKEKSKTSNK